MVLKNLAQFPHFLSIVTSNVNSEILCYDKLCLACHSSHSQSHLDKYINTCIFQNGLSKNYVDKILLFFTIYLTIVDIRRHFTYYLTFVHVDSH